MDRPSQPSTKQQFETILHSVAEGITVQNTKGELVYVNQAGAKIIGFDTPGEVMAASPAEIISKFELFDEQKRPFPLSRLPGRQALQGTNEPAQIIGFRLVGSNDIHWSAVRARPILGEDGQVEFAVNVFQDITELKNAELRLREANQRITKLLQKTLEGDERHPVPEKITA